MCVHIAATGAVIGCLIGGILISKILVETAALHSQVSQIARYDDAVSNFYDKFSGLPGDLLAANALKVGLATGDGSEAHGDGDGRISPCNLEWQSNLGCETALFWSQLSATGMITENFSADNVLANSWQHHVNMMDPYLPKSSLSDGIYIVVWNSDISQASARPQLPYGNYYEISRISGIAQGRITDDVNALTPTEAAWIDNKIDDGSPFSGRVLANGNTHGSKDAWGTYAHPGPQSCVASENIYNTRLGDTPLCHIAILLNCCK